MSDTCCYTFSSTVPKANDDIRTLLAKMLQVNNHILYYTQIAAATGVNHTGAGSPEGVVTANPGDLYWDTTGHSLWIKHTGSGNTGWEQLIA